MLLQIKKDKEEEGETPSLSRNCDSGQNLVQPELPLHLKPRVWGK